MVAATGEMDTVGDDGSGRGSVRLRHDPPAAFHSIYVSRFPQPFYTRELF
jgi:hypothetical protein